MPAQTAGPGSPPSGRRNTCTEPRRWQPVRLQARAEAGQEGREGPPSSLVTRASGMWWGQTCPPTRGRRPSPGCPPGSCHLGPRQPHYFQPLEPKLWDSACCIHRRKKQRFRDFQDVFRDVTLMANSFNLRRGGLSMCPGDTVLRRAADESRT